MTKKSFYMHIDTLDVLDHLSDDQAGQLFKAIHAYHKNIDYELPQLLKVAFTPFKNQYDREQEKYERVCERNRLNGAKGGRPTTQKTQVVIKETQNNPNNHDKDKDKDKDKDTKKKSNGRFAPPSLSEIRVLIIEKNYTVDAEQFFNHYESNGWMVGKNKMKKWQAALAKWNSTGENHARNNQTPERALSAVERVERATRRDPSIIDITPRK